MVFLKKIVTFLTSRDLYKPEVKLKKNNNNPCLPLKFSLTPTLSRLMYDRRDLDHETLHIRRVQQNKNDSLMSTIPTLTFLINEQI